MSTKLCIPKLEYDVITTRKLTVITRDEPALPNVENIGKTKEVIRLLTPKLSFKWRKRMLSVTLASLEKKSYKDFRFCKLFL